MRNQFIIADGGSLDTIYVNFLSAAGGSFPYFIASGHSSPGTSAPRLLTGWTRGVIDTCSGASQCIDEYPSVNCFLGTCSVAFEGVNILARDYINSSVDRRTGIVMADFPGAGLISAIINLNPWNYPPVANADGPYTGNEGSAITFDASASSDQDNDPLQYRWDFDGDGTWDTNWSSNPTASHTWLDDYSGTVNLEVTDGYNSGTASTTVTVNNVAPVITATGATIDENTSATVSGTIVDPGTLDTFTVTIEWGYSTAPTVLNLPAGSTSFEASHTYADDFPVTTPFDTFTVDVSIVDDDDGQGSASTSVTVNNLNPVIASVTNDGPITEGSTSTITVDASDAAGQLDPLTYEFDCDNDGVYEVGPQTANTTVCDFDIQEGTFLVNTRVADNDSGSATGSVEVIVPTFMCVNTMSGVARYVDQPECSRYEIVLTMPEDEPITMCRSRISGLLRVPASGSCAYYETSISLPDQGPLHICINSLSSVMRGVAGDQECAYYEFRRIIGNSVP